jgi:hypothetical protein
MKTYNLAMTFAAALALSAVFNIRAAQPASPVLAQLSTATALEMPAKAAELVSQSDAKNLKQTTIDVVKAAVGLNPAAVAEIVGAIAQSSPQMAATAAATAVKLLPKQAVSIARAAAAAAPDQAGKIVQAVCRITPDAYQEIADAVAEVAPGAGKAILSGIASAIPSLKDSITTVLAGYNGAIPSVSAALDQVSQIQTAAAPVLLASASPALDLGTPTLNPVVSLPRGPSIKAPIVPPSNTPTNTLAPASGGDLPPGSIHTYVGP